MIKWDSDSFMADVRSASRSATEKACLLVVRSVRDHFKKGDKDHPSQPGEIPHVVTGNLKRSIGHEMISDEEGRVGPCLGYIGEQGEPAHNYGYWLEYGNERMSPRPYLRPALMREKNNIIRQYKDFLK